MSDYKRTLSLTTLLTKKSHFLLGPRATGKSFLIRHELQAQAVVIDLLRTDLYLRLSARPWDLEAIIDADRPRKAGEIVVIDEIQKVPGLLDEVHRLIEQRRLRFLLTGSSARKLRHGHANLLAGRAWSAQLFPLTFHEIPHFQLERYLRYGGLPAVYGSALPEEELRAYVKTYLYEEIQAEGLVRKLPQFARFLMAAALSNGHIVNFSSVASDASVKASTVRDYYSILEDTLLGFYVEPWMQSKKRKAITTPKFYLFDPGVTHTLTETQHLERNSDLYGRSFEHWIAMELRAYLSYSRSNLSLCYWRSTHQHEVDFVLGDELAVEVKASARVSDRDCKGLLVFSEELKVKTLLLVSQDRTEARYGSIRCVHWQTFLQELWAGDLI